MPRTKTVPVTPLSLRPGSQGTGLGVGLNCQPFQPPGCLHVLRDDFPKVDSLALGQNLRMDVIGTQGASSNLALQQESVQVPVHRYMCTLWGKGGKLSRFLEDPGHAEGAAAFCQYAQGRSKLSPADLRLTSLHRLPIWAGNREQRLLDVSQGGAPAAGQGRSPLLWKTPPPTAKPSHRPRG